MKKSIAIALAFAAGGLFAGNEASKVPMIVYRGELFDADGNRAPDEANMRRDMKFNFYDTGASGATPLCSCELRDVPINPDGSFEAILADKYLPALIESERRRVPDGLPAAVSDGMGDEQSAAVGAFLDALSETAKERIAARVLSGRKTRVCERLSGSLKKRGLDLSVTDVGIV